MIGSEIQMHLGFPIYKIGCFFDQVMMKAPRNDYDGKILARFHCRRRPRADADALLIRLKLAF